MQPDLSEMIILSQEFRILLAFSKLFPNDLELRKKLEEKAKEVTLTARKTKSSKEYES